MVTDVMSSTSHTHSCFNSGCDIRAMASQITDNLTVCSTACSRQRQRKYQSSISVRGIHWWPYHTEPVMQKTSPCDDVIMSWRRLCPCSLDAPLHPLGHWTAWTTPGSRHQIKLMSLLMSSGLVIRRKSDPNTKYGRSAVFRGHLFSWSLRCFDFQVLSTLPIGSCDGMVSIESEWWLLHDDVIKWKHFPRHWPLCGEFTGHRWIPRTKASDAELWCFLWSAPEWTVGWVSNREAGDLRRHRAHYDVKVMDGPVLNLNLHLWYQSLKDNSFENKYVQRLRSPEYFIDLCWIKCLFFNQLNENLSCKQLSRHKEGKLQQSL